MNYTAAKRHKFKTLLIHLITTLPNIFLGWPGLKAFKACCAAFFTNDN